MVDKLTKYRYCSDMLNKSKNTITSLFEIKIVLICAIIFLSNINELYAAKIPEVKKEEFNNFKL